MPHKRCVHVIDDEAKVREALALLLSTADIASQTYASAEAFLASVPLGEPTCIVLDNQLPGMSGIELLKRVADAGNRPSVVMISGYADVPTAVTAMKIGAFHFAQKPFDPEALLAVIEEALASADEHHDHRAEITEFAARLELLTQREREVLGLLVEGLPTKLIAHRLGISVRTAEHHRAEVKQKMQARTISHLVRMAFSLGYVDGAFSGGR
jgi:two-component system response regulator FixJ